MKNVVATFDTRLQAWNALTEITRKNVMGRHAMAMEPLDPNNPEGPTRLILHPKLGSESKAAKTLLKSLSPKALTEERATAAG